MCICVCTASSSDNDCQTVASSSDTVDTRSSDTHANHLRCLPSHMCPFTSRGTVCARLHHQLTGLAAGGADSGETCAGSPKLTGAFNSAASDSAYNSQRSGSVTPPVVRASARVRPRFWALAQTVASHLRRWSLQLAMRTDPAVCRLQRAMLTDPMGRWQAHTAPAEDKTTTRRAWCRVAHLRPLMQSQGCRCPARS